MNVNLIISVPNGTLLSAQSAEIQEAAKGICAEWVMCGVSATEDLHYVITQTSDHTLAQALIDGFSLPWVIRHNQNSQKTVVVDGNGDPVLDVDDNIQYEVVVHSSSAKSDYLPFFPAGSTVDDVVVGTFAGHEGFAI